MSNNASGLLGVTMSFANKFLGAKGIADGEPICYGTSRTGYVHFLINEEIDVLDISIELTEVVPNRRVHVIGMSVQYKNAEETPSDYLGVKEFALAFRKKLAEPLWFIEKPIDIIAMLKTFNQLSLDLGYKPILKE